MLYLKKSLVVTKLCIKENRKTKNIIKIYIYIFIIIMKFIKFIYSYYKVLYYF